MKTQITLLLLILFSGASFAQFSISADAGYSRAWQNYGNVQLPSGAVTHIHSYNATTSINFALHRNFQVGIAPGYVRRGAACIPGWNEGINPNPIFSGDTRFLLHYVELPFMFSGNLFFWKDQLRLSGSLGYGASILVYGTEETVDLESGEVVMRERLVVGSFGQVKRMDHGAYGEMKFGYNFGKNELYAKSSFYFGMMNAEKFNTSKNRTLSFNLGYSYRF